MQRPEAEVPPEEKEISDLATPTLAEIFYNQGQLYEAISTYEKVLALHPQDEDSMRRLAELKAMKETEARPLRAEDKDFRKKKEKMISILDGWLTRIQELNRGG